MKYFRDTEFKCKCGCGQVLVAPLLAERLDSARYYAGIPVLITSGFRCPKHNANVKGSPTSSHMKGLAADIATPTDGMRCRVVGGLLDAGFTRIGVYPTFVHVDCDPDKRQQVMWLQVGA